MGWLLDIALDLVSEIFGYQVGRGKPWWVEWLAYAGCFTALVAPIALVWFFLL
jgi:hypothetical protein